MSDKFYYFTLKKKNWIHVVFVQLYLILKNNAVYIDWKE
jgi:hypothetical protein